MRILIAPNAFKNSLDARAVADAIEQGLMESKLRCSCEKFPVGDGGDGTAVLLSRQFAATMIPVEVKDPLGRKIISAYGWIAGKKMVVIEMADASGLKLLKPDEYDPLHSNTEGSGELILACLDKKPASIVLGIGGSATTDGGTGILTALGIRFLDAHKKQLGTLPQSLIDLQYIDASGLDQRILDTELIVLCDVQNYLLGDTGAASVFGPQKGADASTVQKLETRLKRLNQIVLQSTGKEMATIERGGAAGGTAAGMAAMLNGRLVSGIDYFLDHTGFDDALQRADLLITGEGSIDDQTLQGKAPYGVAMRAKKHKVPVIALAGKLPDHISEGLLNCFDELISINPGQVLLETALRLTAENLSKTAKKIGDQLATQYP